MPSADTGVRPSLDVVVVGAGPAAVGAALALADRPDTKVTVIDVGGQLEQPHGDARARMAAGQPAAWAPDDRLAISALPVDVGVKGLPEKRAFGSDFPFRDFGQRAGLTASDGVNDALVSGAYGGFSNVWGAQTMPFTRATFRTWPIDADDMYRHYAAILRRIPFAGEEDDLAHLFPLIEGNRPLPPLSDRSAAVLDRYGRHRERLNRRGVILGRARLAMDAPACVRCGLCMTGCPYSLIYSGSHTLDALRADNRIDYRSGLLAVRLREDESGATVVAKDLASGRLVEFRGDRIMVACGAIGSSRLVMGSLDLTDPVEIAESAQFMLPFASSRPVADPRGEADFTLNQFNMAVRLDEEAYDVAQLHFYTYNPSFAEALPSVLRSARAEIPRTHLLRRLSVALGYLPSWASPTFQLQARPAGDPHELPAVKVSAAPARSGRNAMLREVLKRVTSSARALDLWPVLPALKVSAGGKSYHWGGTFPHGAQSRGRFSSDELGRVAPWRRIHLVDASVFPTVPATTFTLSIMANAHRIASEAAMLEQ